jgi:hypothetical protein
MDNNNESSEKDESTTLIHSDTSASFKDDNNQFKKADANYNNDIQLANVDSTSSDNTNDQYTYKAPITNSYSLNSDDVQLEYKAPTINDGGNSADIENQMNLDDYNYIIPTNSDNLPQAVKIVFGEVVFDAPVVTWNTDRPEYISSWGYREPIEVDTNAEIEERKPVFSDADKANPIKFLFKAFGILLALPIYSIYYVIFKPFEYVPPICRFLDRTLFVAIGKLIDFMIFIISFATYYFKIYILNPIYTVLVYFVRIIKFVLSQFIIPFLKQCFEVFLIIIVFPFTTLYIILEHVWNFIYNHRETFLPAIRSVKNGTIIIMNWIKHGIYLLYQGIVKLIEIYIYFLGILLFMTFKLIEQAVIFIFEYVIKPIFRGIVIVCIFIYDYILKPTYDYILVCLYLSNLSLSLSIYHTNTI